MKNTTKIRFVKLTLFAAACLTVLVYSSCNNVLALGDRLYLEGPAVEVIYPASRQPVNEKFYIAGTVGDNLGISEMTIKAVYTTETEKNKELNQQWMWTPEAGWKMSVHNGVAWSDWADVPDIDNVPDVDGNLETMGAKWEEETSSTYKNFYKWQIPVNLGGGREGGQYQFSIAAVNTAGKTDARSSQSKIVVVYEKGPTVQIIAPTLFLPPKAANSELNRLSLLADGNVKARQNPVDIRSFMNGEMNMKWSVNEDNDIWSIDIRFFDWNDDPFVTSVWEDDYIYRLNINADKPWIPSQLRPSQALKPNGSARVPDLSKPYAETEVYADDLDPTRKHDYAFTHEVKNILTEKKTLQVVVRCVNFGGIDNEPDTPTEENFVAGYFIYWPDSDKPWIDSPNGLWGGYREDEEGRIRELYTVFPDTEVFPRAYDDDGVGKVVYRLYKHTPTAGGELGTFGPVLGDGEVTIGDTNNSRIFSWSFITPLEQGEYKIEAEAYDINHVTNTLSPKSYDDTFTGYFKVMDLSFPELRPPHQIPYPEDPENDEPHYIATDPMFMHINTKDADGNESANFEDWTIDIEGVVTVFTEIESVSMVWINPNSVNYAAMSQLSYFRNANYDGWANAPIDDQGANGTAGRLYGWQKDPGLDSTYDKSGRYPNKVWAMKVDYNRVNTRGRKEYFYRKTLNLVKDLNINPGEFYQANAETFAYDYLKSQVFVLKATDNTPPDSNGPKNNIIVWAPQGDTISPKVTVSKVEIKRTGNVADNNLTPGEYADQIEQFQTGDEIIITGTWEEDSTGYLDIEAVLKGKLQITVNDLPLDGLKQTTMEIFTVSSKPLDGEKWTARNGTWKATGEFKRWGTAENLGTHTLVADMITDTLVVSAKVTDMGGNISEHGGVWLIKSDELKFLRVGGSTPDGIYTVGSHTSTAGLADGEIDIFLEFNKPVRLKMLENAETMAAYDGINTDSVMLGLNISGGTLTSRRAVYNKYHPDHLEEVSAGVFRPRASTRQHFTYTIAANHLTPNAGNSALDVASLVSAIAFDATGYLFVWTAPGSGEDIYMTNTEVTSDLRTAKLPAGIAKGDKDYLYTFVAGKQIRIDTTRPQLEGPVAISGKGGWYNDYYVIYLTMKFNEPVYADTSPIRPKSGVVDPDPENPADWEENPDMPRLVLNISKVNDDKDDYDYVTCETTTVQVNNQTLTFVYYVQPGDYTPGTGDAYDAPVYGGSLIVNGFSGIVTDLAGNEYDPAAFGYAPVDSSSPPRPIWVKAIKPGTPSVNVLKASVNSAANLLGTSRDGEVWNGAPVGLKPWDYRNYWSAGATPEANSNNFNSNFPLLEDDPSENYPLGQTGSIVKLGSLYCEQLFLHIEPSGVLDTDYLKVEYSVNYGRDWGVYWQDGDSTSSLTNPRERTAMGYAEITARQVDGAGNYSDWSKPVTLFYDRGDLLTRISSTHANATYTNKPRPAPVIREADQIPITFYFRRKVVLQSAPEIILNVHRREVPPYDYLLDTGDTNPYTASYVTTDFGGNELPPLPQPTPPPGGPPVRAYAHITAPSIPGGLIEEFTFTYTVAPYDTTAGSFYRNDFTAGTFAATDFLDVLDIKFKAEDEYGFDVSDLISLEKVITDTTNLGNRSKRIEVMTGIPELENYTTAGSYNGASDTHNLTITLDFSKEIYKNTSSLYNGVTGKFDIDNEITVIQKAAGYRIPAVLTESEYRLYKSLVNKELDRKDASDDPIYNTALRFDDFYEKGTNGFDSSTGAADVSIKYILKWKYDAYNITPDSATATADEKEFAEAFRQAEKLSLSINSSKVNVYTAQKKVVIDFDGDDALRVLGADYVIYYPAGFIQDKLGNTCKELDDALVEPNKPNLTGKTSSYTATSTVSGVTYGVSRPFIRVSKPQEKIFEAGVDSALLIANGLSSAHANQAASPNWPRWVAIQPQQIEFVIDCRTPGATAVYTESSTTDTDTDNGIGTINWTNSNGSSGSLAALSAPVNDAEPVAGSTAFVAGSSESRGPARTSDGATGTVDTVYQGYKNLIRAKGIKGTVLSSNEAAEALYRTVVTFNATNIGTEGGGRTFNTDSQVGNQLWIRGGNTAFGTTIPGYPLTLSDNFKNLDDGKERAGIRLMTRVEASNTTPALQSSTWQWVSWEIKALTNVIFYLGRDTGTSRREVFQYGPRQFASQTGGGTFFIQNMIIAPGGHWVFQNNSPTPSGAGRLYDFSFMGSFDERDEATPSLASWPTGM